MTATLILDFEGVCTRSPAEQNRQSKKAGSDSSPGLADIVRPEAVAAMRAARAGGLSTVILSNELDRQWLNGLELTASTDHVVVGADNGIFKPDRRAFQRCLLLTGSVAERTVLVDDHPDNVIAADSLGMNAILFKAGVAVAVPIDHAHWASYLLAAIDERREVQAITKQIDEPTVDDAYAIQAALLELQLARGDKLSWPRTWQARGSLPKMCWTPPRRWWVVSK